MRKDKGIEKVLFDWIKTPMPGEWMVYHLLSSLQFVITKRSKKCPENKKAKRHNVFFHRASRKVRIPVPPTLFFLLRHQTSQNLQANIRRVVYEHRSATKACRQTYATLFPFVVPPRHDDWLIDWWVGDRFTTCHIGFATLGGLCPSCRRSGWKVPLPI